MYIMKTKKFMLLSFTFCSLFLFANFTYPSTYISESSVCPLETFDANSDSQLNADEYEQASECQVLNGTTAVPWAEIDLDKNGWVSQEEYWAAYPEN